MDSLYKCFENEYCDAIVQPIPFADISHRQQEKRDRKLQKYRKSRVSKRYAMNNSNNSIITVWKKPNGSRIFVKSSNKILFPIQKPNLIFMESSKTANISDRYLPSARRVKKCMCSQKRIKHSTFQSVTSDSMRSPLISYNSCKKRILRRCRRPSLSIPDGAISSPEIRPMSQTHVARKH